METLLITGLIISFIYAFALVATLAYDLISGRFKRLKSLRTNIEEAGVENTAAIATNSGSLY